MVEKLQHERFIGRKSGMHGSVGVLLRRVATLTLAIVLVFLVIGTWRTYEKQQEAYDMKIRAEHEFSDLAAREKSLQTQIGDLTTARGKEAALRERYGLAREGERMVVIVEPENRISTTTVPTWRSWMKGILR